MEFTYAVYGIVVFTGIYLLTGLLFYMVLLTRGISKIDPHAKNTRIGFKLLIMPGVMAFWPILWRKWNNKKPL